MEINSDMIYSLSRFGKRLSNTVLFKIQLIMSFIALGRFTWDMVSWVKVFLLAEKDFKLYPWIYVFFFPYDSTLVNYLTLCIVVGFVGLGAYLFQSKISDIIENKTKDKRLLIVAALTISLMMIIVSLFLQKNVSLLIVLIPLIVVIDLKSVLRSRFLIQFCFILLTFISFEPFVLITRPIYLMNEYQELYADTIIDGEYVDNINMLDNLREIDIDSIKLLYMLQDSQGIAMPDNIDFFMSEKYKTRNIDALKQHVISTDLPAKFSEPNTTQRVEDLYKNLYTNLRTVDVEKIKQLYNKNALEYSFQNMNRGQINHIGHMLNPINEIELGKPIKEIYMQYGLGSTFIFKWTMELFGGISINNYYKCYLYYIFYFITFFIMLHFIFKDWLYVIGGLAFLCLAYFYQGYIALILAPGIIPLIHFFDTSVIMLALIFFRRSRPAYLWLVVLVSALGIVINRQFGCMLMFSLLISAFLYIIENKKGSDGKLCLLSLATVSIISLFVFHLSKGGSSDETFSYFLLGLFSWPANPIIISLTILYLIVSYLFMFYLKEEKFYLKYIYLVVFIYTQSLLVYYYWSGLSNHLPTVIPFAGLQLMLMLYISERILFKGNEVLEKSVNYAVSLIPVVLILLVLSFTLKFYKEKRDFSKNFINHMTYNWDLKRANIITTINPDSILGSINLIHKYTEGEKGIYIISKYDNLLPFLAERYSLMPYFEMAWHLFSDKESNKAIDRIKAGHPKYIFADSNIDQETITDPWAKIYNDDWTVQERTSRIGRYRELYNIFNAVKDDYELIERGELLSVYKKKP